MDLDSLIERFSGSRADREKAIFSTLFIAGNRLQTLFDSRIPALTLKQFMLLSILRQSPRPMTCTDLGALLGCSRQNVKKLALALEKKGFVAISPSPTDGRALALEATAQAQAFFQGEFSRYQQELGWLFEVYDPQEVDTLFHLLTKLYAGIHHLEQKTRRLDHENRDHL